MIEEIENIADSRKKECNNAYHLSCVIRENVSDKYNSFITSYALSYGVEELIGTEYFTDSGTIPTKLAYKILNYPLNYSKSLFE